jgi:uncharacterized membrane protein
MGILKTTVTSYDLIKSLGNVHKSAVSRILRKLEKAGIIQVVRKFLGNSSAVYVLASL